MCKVPGMNKLKHYLEDNKIARRDFAALIGVDQSVLSRFCNDLARPGLEKAVAIERATGGEVPAAFWVDKMQPEDRAPNAPDPTPETPTSEKDAA